MRKPAPLPPVKPSVKSLAECHWVELERGSADFIEVIEATEELSVFTVGRLICALLWCATWATTARVHWDRTEGYRMDLVGALASVSVAVGIVWIMR